MSKFFLPVSKEAVEHGFRLGLKVFQDKMNWPDKFNLGLQSGLQADVHGFICESVVNEFFGVALPSFTPKKNDEFDLKLKGLRIDVKKVGYDSNKRVKIVINKRQFERKKDKIDGFMFCTFTGAFNYVMTDLGYQVNHPLPELSKLNVLGWLPTGHVELKSKLYEWKDRNGKVIDVSLKLLESDLKSVEELCSEEQLARLGVVD
jgi:hypothetical protein